MIIGKDEINLGEINEKSNFYVNHKYLKDKNIALKYCINDNWFFGDKPNNKTKQLYQINEEWSNNQYKLRKNEINNIQKKRKMK